jgi:hypothetical protein
MDKIVTLLQLVKYLFSHGSTAPVGLELLYEVPRSHSDTPNSVVLLWMSDRPVADTST